MSHKFKGPRLSLFIKLVIATNRNEPISTKERKLMPTINPHQLPMSENNFVIGYAGISNTSVILLVGWNIRNVRRLDSSIFSWSATVL